MSNRVAIELAYNRKVLIDVADLPKLMAILEGATLISYGYVGNDRIDYIEDDTYHLEFTQAPNKCYVTEEQYKAQLEAEEANEGEAA